tara:strand:+ start:1149 stop:1415 length:267 start_codon:yes stop_codon:yes gene_type:complete
MNKNFVIFKNPHLRYRKENFGGIVKLKLKTLIINKRQYELIKKIKKVLVYNKLNNLDKKITDKLIENNILLKVDLSRARELGFDCQKN